MEDKHKHLLWLIGGLIAAVLLFNHFTKPKTPTSTEPVPSSPNDQFYAPYYYPSPGIYPENVPFESTVNVYVESPTISALSNQYMPLYGFVGMVGVGFDA